MEKFKEIAKNLFESIKSDKKKMIICIVAAVLLVILIWPKNSNKKSSEGFGSEISTVVNSAHTASGDITLCNYSFSLNAAQDENGDCQFGFTGEETDCKELITKTDNTLYFNYSEFSDEGINYIKCNAVDEDSKDVPVALKELVFEALNSDLLEYTQEESYSEVKLSSDNWSQFWTDLADSIAENEDSIIKGYKDSGYVKDELNLIIKDLKKLAASDESSNYLSVTLSMNEDESYTLTLDSSLSFDALPDFIQETEDSFNSNQFTVYASLSYDMNSAAISAPKGYVQAFDGSGSIHDFISSCWSSVFAKKEYTPINNTVSVSSDTVTNDINLGSTHEIYQFVFNSEGCKTGLLTVTTTNKKILTDVYLEKYGNGDSTLEDSIVYENDMFSISFALDDSAISSINKIGTTAKAVSDYLKSDGGVMPI